MAAFLQYAAYRFAISVEDACHLTGALLGAMFLYGGADFSPRREYEPEIHRLISEASGVLPQTPSKKEEGIGPIDVLGARILRLFSEREFGLEQSGAFTRIFMDFMKNSAGVNIEAVVRATPVLQLLLKSTGYRRLSKAPEDEG
jgi:hypothetical protein